MRRTLLITNDYPPRVGGIQSYVHELATRLAPDRLVVLASDHPDAAVFDAAQPFPVVRHSASVLLPTPAVGRQARELIRRHNLTAVWYGAAAPLALLTPGLRASGVVRTVGSTHGHEVGWAMLPGSRQLLRRIGDTNDVLTFVSRYARRRIASALGPRAALEWLPPGVDTTRFAPRAADRARIRQRYGLTERHVIVCISRLVPRKGQDVLIAAMADIARRHRDATLLIVGAGSYERRLRALAARSEAAAAIRFAGSVAGDELVAYYNAGDVFAMPCRTRGAGLDVEGLGIVFLEASACGLPVLAGDSGGAPETVRAEQSGLVVDGRDVGAVVSALDRMLADSRLRDRWGSAGRDWVVRSFSWDRAAARLAQLLSG